ncbi:MAG: DEAD/DEAH box helicase [Verrucomicrobiaceae bacterium]|nr:MAG: DEAD/DEAH box helicase [Verrucomicrobiaceae bacterium]
MPDPPQAGAARDNTPPPEALSGLALEMHEAFSETGMLSRSPDFEYRSGQQRMAVEVGQALEKRRAVIIEAGTGVGKSLAYLLPAALTAHREKRKAVVSTHTINLQEQLIAKDIPIVQKLLPHPFTAVLLKGRANYLCPQRLSRAMRGTSDLFSTAEHEELRALWKWRGLTEDGTLSDLNFTPSPNVWSQVCSEPHACTPRSCGPESGCFYQNARRRAAEAEMVVLNHTLFFTMLSAQEELGVEGEGFLFPNDFVVLDEAHTLENVAAKQLGLHVSQSGLRFDLHRLYNPRTQKGLFAQAKSVEGVLASTRLLEHMETFFAAVRDAARFGPAGREFRVRTGGLVENILHGPLLEVVECVRKVTDDKEAADSGVAEITEMGRRVSGLRAELEAFLTMSREGHVYWVERSGVENRNISLHAAPVDVSGLLRQLFFSGHKTCVMTSATFGAGEPNLRYFRRRCGAEKVRAVEIGSPFDWEKQMRLHLVRHLPDPNSPGYEAALEQWIRHFLEQSQGRAFVLFTSYRLMESMSARLESWCQERHWTLLVQGKGRPRHQLLQDFKDDISSVLFGTESFWTGVDVPGESLSNVIITRLPFAVPDHPLTAARLEYIEDRGGNPFSEYSVPEAVLKLRQGIGRLIRTRRDHGIAVILDPRVLTKSYGKIFLDSLPPAPRVIAD